MRECTTSTEGRVKSKMKAFTPKLVFWITVAASGVFCSTARAASTTLTWDWSYTCKLCVGGSGTFTTTEQQGSGESQYYLVTAMTGIVEGHTIVELLSTNWPGLDNDNKLNYPSGSPYSNEGHKITGIGFLIDYSGLERTLLFNNYQDVYAGYYTQIAGPQLSLLNIDFKNKQVLEETSSVPEPSSFYFSLLGCIALVGLLLGSNFKKSLS